MSVQSSYATALLEAALETGLKASDLDRIEQELAAFTGALERSRELSVAMASPIVSSSEKAALALEISRAMGFSELSARFIAIAARKNRVSLFSEIAHAFSEVRLEREGAILGTVVSAGALQKTDLEELSGAFTKRLGRKVVFKSSTDASLLAGLKVTVSGVTYDASLRSQLYQLRDQLVHGRA